MSAPDFPRQAFEPTRAQEGFEMIRSIVAVIAALLLSATAIRAQTPPKIEKVPIKPTVLNGAKMFNSYCAVCHGPEGKGNGPAAAALTKKPADLTQISARNGGNFPTVMVSRYIEGADEVPAHGTRDMPMWGDLFRSLDRDTAQMRVAELNAYLKSLQK
jgi:mono/diheme cytochrome c family protein